MSGLRRFTVHPDRLRAEHERALALAATGLVEALSPADAAVLASHLDSCRDCRQAALDYALQGERIRNLATLELPRDAWPAFAARLDLEEAHAAERRARRAGSQRVASQAHPLGSRPSRAPGTFVPVAAGAGVGHRGAPVAASVGVGSLLALVATIALVASGLPRMIAGPSATPFAVDSSSVAWVTRQADGRFLLQAAPLDSACPAGRTTCADFGERPSTIVALDMEPASVFLSRGGRDAIVVDAGAAGAGTAGGSVYAIELPTPYPAGAAGAAGEVTRPDRTTSAGGLAAGVALATAVATAVVGSQVPASSSRPARVAPPTPPYPTTKVGVAETAEPLATFVTAGGPGASLPAAVPLPTAAVTRAIAEGVVLIGSRAGYSPDGRWFAFSARPADGSAGPDVYVWRVGDERSRAVTSDHDAVFAGWVGRRLLVSSPDGTLAEVAGPAGDASADAEAGGTEKAAGSTGATAKPKPAAATAKPKPAAATAATPRPKKKASPAPATDATSSAPTAASASPVAPGEKGTAAPGEAEPVQQTIPISYLLDVVSGDVTRIDLPGLWLPSVDPTGTRVVAWLGTVSPDPATRSWRPMEGSLVVGSWAAVLGGSAATPAPVDEDATSLPVGAEQAGTSATPEATAEGAGPAGPDTVATPAPDGATTPSPDVAATPTPKGAVKAETAAPSAPAAAPGSGSTPPGETATDDRAPAGSPTATAGPDALRALTVAGIGGRPPATWQVRWDPAGTHLAVWLGDVETPEVGELSLLAVDPTGAAAPTLLLSATPAMPGFAMGKSRIAWAVPADGTPTGGRVRVLVWSGPSVGEAGTAPIRGFETLVDAD